MAENEVIFDSGSKKVFETGDPHTVIMCYTDIITAYNRIKKAVIKDKGSLNCSIASRIFEILEAKGVPTHFVRRVSECEMLCHKANVFKLEVIVRNVIAGTMARRLGLEEGIVPTNMITEFCYDKEELNYPLINEDHAVALGLATYNELSEISRLAEKINLILKPFFADRGIILVDFKLQFGRLNDGKIALIQSITPDNARFWDADTGERLDKDRFRRDLGHVGDAYREVYKRILQG